MTRASQSIGEVDYCEGISSWPYRVDRGAGRQGGKMVVFG